MLTAGIFCVVVLLLPTYFDGIPNNLKTFTVRHYANFKRNGYGRGGGGGGARPTVTQALRGVGGGGGRQGG